MDLGPMEIEREMHILIPDTHKIALGRRADTRFIQRKLRAVLFPCISEQEGLYVTIRRDLKFGRTRGQDRRSAWLDVHIDLGKMRGLWLCGLCLRRRLRQFRARSQRERKIENDAEQSVFAFARDHGEDSSFSYPKYRS